MFKIAIYDDTREFVFKLECEDYFDGLLFYIASFTQGYKKEDWFDNADYSFKFFNREDFEKICDWAKKYAEII